MGTPKAFIRRAAKTLCEEGFAHIPYRTDDVRELEERFAEFCTKPLEERKLWTFEVEKNPNGPEADDGYLPRFSEEGKDIKHAFHARPCLARRLEERGSFPEPESREHEFLCLTHQVFLEHKSIVLDLAEAIDELGVYRFSVCNELLQTFGDNRVETSRATVRILHYPPHKEETVAKPHVDRNGLSLHAGAHDGRLLAYFDGKKIDVSPDVGEMLIFWGHKATMVARECGQMIPALVHESEAVPGTTRQATVSFWHFNRVLWNSPRIEWELLRRAI